MPPAPVALLTTKMIDQCRCRSDDRNEFQLPGESGQQQAYGSPKMLKKINHARKRRLPV